MRKFSYGAHIVNQNPSNPKFLCVLFALNLLYVPLVPYRGHRYDLLPIFDRLIKKKTPKRLCVVTKKSCLEKCVVNWAAEPYTSESIWHVSFGMFLPSDPKRKTALAAWWTAAAGTIQGHGNSNVEVLPPWPFSRCLVVVTCSIPEA